MVSIKISRGKFPRPGPDTSALRMLVRLTAVKVAAVAWNPERNHGNRNGIRNTESNINDRKLKDFTLHNLVQSKENLL